MIESGVEISFIEIIFFLSHFRLELALNNRSASGWNGYIAQTNAELVQAVLDGEKHAFTWKGPWSVLTYQLSASGLAMPPSIVKKLRCDLNLSLIVVLSIKLGTKRNFTDAVFLSLNRGFFPNFEEISENNVTFLALLRLYM